MNSREVLSYLAGTHYLKRHLDYQQRIPAENTGSNEPHLPFDGDVKTAGRVYVDRLRTMIEYPIVVISRLTGVDAVIRKIR